MWRLESPHIAEGELAHRRKLTVELLEVEVEVEVELLLVELLVELLLVEELDRVDDVVVVVARLFGRVVVVGAGLFVVVVYGGRLTDFL